MFWLVLPAKNYTNKILFKLVYPGNIYFLQRNMKHLYLIWKAAIYIIATDKRGYPHNTFLISPRKHMLWVLIRSASVRHF